MNEVILLVCWPTCSKLLWSKRDKDFGSGDMGANGNDLVPLAEIWKSVPHSLFCQWPHTGTSGLTLFVLSEDWEFNCLMKAD